MFLSTKQLTNLYMRFLWELHYIEVWRFVKLGADITLYMQSLS